MYSFNHSRTRVAVRDQLLDLMATQPVSTVAGEVLIHLGCPNGDNSFVVPLTSPYFRDWLTVRQKSRNLPAPSDAQFREAIRIRQSECLDHHAGCPPSALNLRYAWDPRHLIPALETRDGIIRRNFFNAPHEPAYVMALDVPLGRHASITSSRWFLQPSQTTFLCDPSQEPIPDPVHPLDEPEMTLQPFRRLLRLGNARFDSTWQTLLAWILTAMRAPRDPARHSYPILNLIGSVRSGKSVTARLLKQLIDPATPPLLNLPSTERGLHGLAAHHHLLVFDDAGKINPEKSRHLSRLSAGVDSRHPYIAGILVRPIILTTSGEDDTRDLSHNVVDVELPPIENSRPEQEIQQEFAQQHPYILGSLLTLLVRGFNAPAVFPHRKPENEKIERTVTGTPDRAW